MSQHARDVLSERGIPEEWVRRTIEGSDWITDGPDGNRHLYKSIHERDGRFLHVVLNAGENPEKVVTAFFDRRARRP